MSQSEIIDAIVDGEADQVDPMNVIAEGIAICESHIRSINENANQHYNENSKILPILSEILIQSKLTNSSLNELIKNSKRMIDLLSKPPTVPARPSYPYKPQPLIPMKRTYGQISIPSPQPSSNEERFIRPCPICNTKKHKASNCPVTSRSVRRTLIALNNLCPNCLRSPQTINHTDSCATHKCSSCQVVGHHCLLCPTDPTLSD